jgi:hypothetical protein
VATLAEDTFVDASGTALDAHTPTGTTPGTAWTRVDSVGSDPIVIGPSGETRLGVANNGRRMYRMAKATAYPADYSVEGEFRWLTNDLQNDIAEIGLRITGTNDGYVLRVINFSNGNPNFRYRLYRIQQFTADFLLAESADILAPANGTVVTGSITAIGNRLWCQAGGVNLFDPAGVVDTMWTSPGMPGRGGVNGSSNQTNTTGIHVGALKAKTAILVTDTTHLGVITQPAGAQTGAAFLQQPVVELRDSLDQPVHTAGVTVTASINTGGGALGGTLTAVTDAFGRATFANLQITGAGTDTLAFAATGLIAVVSAPFPVVAAGLATQIVVATQPGTIPAGAGAAYPYQPLVVEARNNANVLDKTYGQIVAGVGTVSCAAGTATFSTSQVGKVFDGVVIQIAGVWYDVSGLVTTGPNAYKQCTLSSAPTFGASAFNVSLSNGYTSDYQFVHAILDIKTGPPGAVLNGPQKINFLTGKATFYGVALSVPGSYTYEIRSSFGLKSAVTGSFTVPTPVDQFYNPAPGLRGLGAALPRTVPNRARPGIGGRTVRRVGPSRTYTTIQAAHDASGPNDRILLDLGVTFTEEVLAHPKAYVAGQEITIESDGWALTPGQRAGQIHFLASGKPIWQPVNVNGGVITFESGASPCRLLGLELRTNPAIAGTSQLLNLGYADGDPLASGIPEQLWIEQCWMHHDDPTAAHTANRAVRWRARNSGIIDSTMVGFQHTAAPDAQSILCDGTPGNLLLENCDIEGESEGFMIGGTDFRGPEYVPQDVTIRRCIFRKPRAQMGVWQPKNLFEFKAGHRIDVNGCIGDGFWDANVSQFSSVNAKSVSQTGNPIEGFVGASDITIRNCLFRNVPDLFTIHGEPSPPTAIACRFVFDNILCVNANSTTWSTAGAGDGQLVHVAASWDVLLNHISFISAPRASLLRTLLIGTMSGPTQRFALTNALIQTDLAPATIISGTSAPPNINGVIQTLDPAARFDFIFFGGLDPAWLTYNQSNSPANALFSVANGAGDAPDPGFANYAARSTADTADPVTLCDAFTLTSGVCKGSGTAGSDRGVRDMPALKTAITGVMTGAPEIPQTADHLAVTQQPSVSGASGAALATAPIVSVLDSGGFVVGADATTVTAALDAVSGTGTLVGINTKVAVAGVADFTANGLGAASAGGGVFRFRFSRAGLPDVYSSTFTIPSPPGVVALVVVRAPSAAKARSPFTVQPIVKAVRADGTTATEFTGIITAFKRGGRGTLQGTLSMRAVDGVASWTDLKSTMSAPILLGFYTLEVDV